MSIQKPIMPLEALRAFCKEHHITKLALYGSMLGDHFKSTSDVDLLAYFDRDHTPSLCELAACEEMLSSLIGRRVDLRTPGDLSPYFKQDVLNGMKVLYEV